MNATAISFTLALALAVVSPAMAQATQPHAHHPAAAASADVDVPVTAEAAVAVAERFNRALSSGDLATVEALLAADVLILESGVPSAAARNIWVITQSAMRHSSRAPIASCSVSVHAPLVSSHGSEPKASCTPRKTVSH